MEITVIIPAYNESGRIGKTLRSILDYMTARSFIFEIIVVDDGSTDTTAQVVKNLNDERIKLISIGGNRGKGFAVWKGLSKARFELALFSDADLSTPIEDIELLVPFVKTHGVIIGSRNLPDSCITKPQPWIRSHLGKSFPLLVRMLVLPGIADSQCGFKLFTKSAISVITAHQTINDFGFDVEIIYLCRKAGLLIKEVGVHWGNAEGSKVRIMSDSWRMLLDLFRIRWNDLTGKYPVALDAKPHETSIPLHGGHY